MYFKLKYFVQYVKKVINYIVYYNYNLKCNEMNT